MHKPTRHRHRPGRIAPHPRHPQVLRHIAQQVLESVVLAVLPVPETGLAEGAQEMGVQAREAGDPSDVGPRESRGGVEIGAHDRGGGETEQQWKRGGRDDVSEAGAAGRGWPDGGEEDGEGVDGGEEG